MVNPLYFQVPYLQVCLFTEDFPCGSGCKDKNTPATQETWVRSLGWEDSLEKVMATHSSILAQEIPWAEEPGGLQSIGLQTVRHD